MMQWSLWKQWLYILGLSGLFVLPGAHPSIAQQRAAHSGPQTVALLELYTSEGCSSCPPADTWVSSLAARGFGLDRLIPLGLHVDYWDSLGWPDRFAQAMFTQRQRMIAARHRSRTIYTPQVVLQGQELRHWKSLDVEVQRINQTKARADIRLQAWQDTPQTLAVVAQATVTEAGGQPQAKLYVVLYENQLSSKVTAGENRGRTLQHDFVVRRWLGPLDGDAQGMARLQETFALSRDWKPQAMGLVAFVQHATNGDVLQALALPLGP